MDQIEVPDRSLRNFNIILEHYIPGHLIKVQHSWTDTAWVLHYLIVSVLLYAFRQFNASFDNDVHTQTSYWNTYCVFHFNTFKFQFNVQCHQFCFLHSFVCSEQSLLLMLIGNTTRKSLYYFMYIFVRSAFQTSWLRFIDTLPNKKERQIVGYF